MKYRHLVGEWMRFWLPTTAELDAAMSASGWRLVERRLAGPNRIDCHAADA